MSETGSRSGGHAKGGSSKVSNCHGGEGRGGGEGGREGMEVRVRNRNVVSRATAVGPSEGDQIQTVISIRFGSCPLFFPFFPP